MTRTMINRQIALARKRLLESQTQTEADSAAEQINALNEELSKLDSAEKDMAARLAQSL
jgi:hypothetical protein